MKKIIGIILGLIIGLAVGVGGTYFLLNNKYVDNCSSDVTIDYEQVESLDIYDDLVQENFNQVLSDFHLYNSRIKYLLNDSKLKNTEVSNDLVYEDVFSYFYELNKTESFSVSTDDWNNKVKELYGSDYEFDESKYTTATCEKQLYYDSSAKEYKFKALGCGGGTSGPHSFALAYINKAEKTDNKLFIYVKMLFPDTSDTLESMLNSKGYVKYYSDVLQKHELDLTYDQYADSKDVAYPTDDYTNIQKGGNYLIAMNINDDGTYSFAYSEYLDK